MEEGKYLISTSDWFYAPDGRQYKAVWGDVSILQDSFLGVKTNAISANWYAKVGTEENHVIVAGCQIHYAVKSEKEPNNGKVVDDNFHEGKYVETERLSRIYIAK